MEERELEMRTERLLLRPFRFEDVDDVFEYAADPEWGRYVTPPMPYLRKHAEEYLARQILTPRDEPPSWAIVLDGKVVGGVGIRIKAEHATGMLGYSIAKGHWGKGLVPEAARAVIDWGFRERELAKVWACADVRNAASQTVMQKLGMTYEGTLRGHRRLRDEQIDCVYYGLLREEWEENRG